MKKSQLKLIISEIVKQAKLLEVISPKSVATIDKWRKEVGDRQTGIKLIDYVLNRRIGLSSADLADTTIFANGLDTIEELLKDGNYEGAIRQAMETAQEMVEDEGGEGIWEEGQGQGWAGADDNWISHPVTPATKKEPKRYSEYGIVYCHIDPKKEQCPPDMKIFSYVEKHIPTKKKFPKQICCYNESDFRKLLKHWTTAMWKYEPTNPRL